MGHLGPRGLFIMSTASTCLNEEINKSHHIQRGHGQGAAGHPQGFQWRRASGDTRAVPTPTPLPKQAHTSWIYKGGHSHWAVPTLGAVREAPPGTRWHQGGACEQR